MNVRHTRQILVVNGKGGCGKTTIATNLATAYACRGHSVVLKDQDHQASSSDWHAQRPEDLAAITLVESHQRNAMYETRAFQTRSLVASDYVIIDSPSFFVDMNLSNLLRNIDAIVVPIQASPFDIHVSSRFLADLLTHRNYRAHPIPVGVVANRIKQNSACHKKLKHFLECLDVPSIATLSDGTIYTDMAEQGTGMLDPDNKARNHKDLSQWQCLLGWLDEQMNRDVPGLQVQGQLFTNREDLTKVSRGPKSATHKQISERKRPLTPDNTKISA